MAIDSSTAAADLAGEQLSHESGWLRNRMAWTKSAPKPLRNLTPWGDTYAGWEQWTEFLQLHLVESLEKTLPGKDSPLTWGLMGPQARSLQTLFPPLGKQASGVPGESAARVSELLAAAGTATTPEPLEALTALAWAYALRPLAAEIGPDYWWQLVEHLVELAIAAESIDIQRHPLVHQLLAGELPLALSYTLPELKSLKNLSSAGRRELIRGVDALLDGEGLLHAQWTPLWRPLMACWTRARSLAPHLKHGCWNPAAEAQYSWLVRQTLRFSLSTGDSLTPPETVCSGPLLEAALQLAGDEEDLAIAALAFKPASVARLVSAKQLKKIRPQKLPSPTVQSDWAEHALLRSGWKPDADLLAVNYSEKLVHLNLAAAGQRLLAGPWDLEIKVDGRPQAAGDEWESVCWVSDKDLDYLELQATFGEDVTVQRQIALAREDRVLLLADAILAPKAKKIQYRSSLPLIEGASYEPAAETFEGALVTGNRQRATLLPLAFPEWRDAVRGAPVGLDAEQRITCELTGTGTALFVPLVFDLQPRRFTRPLTWRKLTVAENREIVPDDLAVGYRFELDKKQWLLYRSLGPQGNRTLLGVNLITEFLFARFDRGGEADSLIEIE